MRERPFCLTLPLSRPDHQSTVVGSGVVAVPAEACSL